MIDLDAIDGMPPPQRLEAAHQALRDLDDVLRPRLRDALCSAIWELASNEDAPLTFADVGRMLGISRQAVWEQVNAWLERVTEPDNPHDAS